MKLYTKKDRSKLPDSVFADPASRLFPIRTLEEATESVALLGRLPVEKSAPVLERVKQIMNTKGWKIAGFGEEVKFEDSDLVVGDAVLFERGDDSYAEGDYIVYPNRKLFPAGYYKSHNYDMTPEELTVAAYSTPEVPLDIDHKDSIIKDEYIGIARNFNANWEDDTLVKRGDIAIHKLLDPLLKDETKMSTTWNRATKELDKVALLLNPRIPDAELKPAFEAFTAFAKTHQTYSGLRAVQSLHDRAVQGGAVCSADNAKMASKAENKAIQKVHDDMVAAGATCESMSDASSRVYEYYSNIPAFTGAGLLGDRQPTPTPAADPPVSSPAEAGGGGTNDASGSAGEGSQDMTEAEKAAMSGANPELVAMQKKIDEMARKNRQKDADIAFSDLLRANKILPGAKAQFMALFEQLSADDEADQATVKFGEKDSDALSRADLLKTLFAGTKAHRHDEEFLKVRVGGKDAEGEALYEDTGDSHDETRKRTSARALKYAGVNGNGKAAK